MPLPVVSPFPIGNYRTKQVYRSATEVSVTAYEPKSSETLRAVLPIRGTRGVSVWIQWEVEMATFRRKRELLRRLGEVQRVRDGQLSYTWFACFLARFSAIAR